MKITLPNLLTKTIFTTAMLASAASIGSSTATPALISGAALATQALTLSTLLAFKADAPAPLNEISNFEQDSEKDLMKIYQATFLKFRDDLEALESKIPNWELPSELGETILLKDFGKLIEAIPAAYDEDKEALKERVVELQDLATKIFGDYQFKNVQFNEGHQEL